MTPDAALNPIEDPKNQIPSTVGMTTKVVKGSIWTLGGSVLPLAVSFISTPFIIRFLGAESYGVLILVGLIPTYFSFADFGMGVASTKFASEAFGEGDAKRETEFVWTAATVAAISSLLVATPIFIFSYYVVRALNVPEHLLAEASLALKITSVAFVLGILAAVLNSPMLARLRMDLNTLTQATPRVLLAIVTPIVLFLGGGIVGAVSWSFIITVGTFVAVLFFSTRLLPRLARPTFNRERLRPLLTFGGGWLVAMIASMLLVNLEKIFLTKMVSVEALAYYSVAFTVANMALLFNASITQSLVPAFSQLQGEHHQEYLGRLFNDTIRLSVLTILPGLMILFVIAEQFFTLWAGPDFGAQSTSPFYLLLIGILFNVFAFIPYSALTAAGRVGVIAKLFWIELGLYIVTLYLLVDYLGIVGAALAWTIRVCIDSIAMIFLARHTLQINIDLAGQLRIVAIGLVLLIVPVLLSTFAKPPATVIITAVLISLLVYSLVSWRWLLDERSRTAILSRLNNLPVLRGLR